MKTFILSSICILFTHFTAFSQKNSLEDSRNIKEELESYIMVLETYKTQVPEYQILIDDYNQIVAGVNGAYRKAARRIANGYTLVRRRNITKKNTDIARSIDYYHKKGESLYKRIGIAIDKARGDGSNLMASANGDGIVLFGGAVLTLVTIIEETLHRKACRNAADFYGEARWLDANEVLSGDPTEINWKVILGARCSASLN